MAKTPMPEPVGRKSVSLPASLWDRVSEYRHTHRIPSEAEALRRIVAAGLDVEEAKAPKKGRR